MTKISKITNFLKSDIGKKVMLFAAWLLIVALSLALPLYESVVFLRGGYELAHIQSSPGRNFFTIIEEGYESQFLYDIPSVLYTLPIIIVFLISVFIFVPQFFKSESKLEDNISRDALKAKKEIKFYKNASLPWFSGAFLIVALSSPEIACLVTLFQSQNSLFLSTDETLAVMITSIVTRAILIVINVLIFVASRRMTKKSYCRLKEQLDEALANEEIAEANE